MSDIVTKNDPTTSTTTTFSNEQKSQIVKQMEFYFSEHNFPYDNFLQQLSQSNEERWIPITTILTFNRMKKYRPADEVVNVLREQSTILEISTDGENIRRKIPLKLDELDKLKSNQLAKSCVLTNFPISEETNDFLAVQDRIEKFIDQTCNAEKKFQFKQIRLKYRRRFNNKYHKRSINGTDEHAEDRSGMEQVAKGVDNESVKEEVVKNADGKSDEAPSAIEEVVPDVNTNTNAVTTDDNSNSKENTAKSEDDSKSIKDNAGGKIFIDVVVVELDTPEQAKEFITHVNESNIEYENKKIVCLSQQAFNQQRMATKNKHFSGKKRSRSFSGPRKNMVSNRGKNNYKNRKFNRDNKNSNHKSDNVTDEVNTADAEH
ncbi:tRNA maturation protein LHP1 SCDLUD_004224 [Saccharomycodes ludwigii]|uniref:tRNA maturation protein LHP1 n=1 Tax=Saccharomycodes ludwigii TaxID=36035 RepID=UPI001E86CCCC|nr:hypothetical protein SCDLUD_004224 [Saccharomycodes ludwigii]KAH3899912.1 hypothetical protein SCDLUD_004224 [Saccharomycodes ludwigii]